MNGSRHSAVSAAQTTSACRLTTERPVAACLLTLMFACVSGAVCAEVHVSGDVNAIRIEASQSKISEILSALRQEYNVKYQSSIALDEAVTGIYSGSLKQVLPRILDGYTYVIKKTETSTEVLVNGRQGVRAIPGAAVTNAPPAKNLAAQWKASLDEAARATPKSGQ